MGEGGPEPRPSLVERSGWARAALAVAASLLVVAGIEVLRRFRFETNDDLTFAFAMTGSALLPPQGDFYLFFRGGLGELLSLLHGWFGPSTYGAFLLGLLALSLARFFARLLALPDRHGAADLAATFAAAAGIVALAFSTLNFSRIALLAAFVGFDGLQARWADRERRGAGVWIDALLVLLGYAVRPQAGLLALALAVALRLPETWRARALARSLVAAAAVVAAFWAYDRLATSPAEEEYVRRYWWATHLLDRAAPIAWPEDRVDVARLNLAAGWLFFDDAAYNSAFLEKHVRARGFDAWTTLASLPRRTLRLLRRVASFGGLWLPPLLLWLSVEPAVAGDLRRASAPLVKSAVVLAALLSVDVFAGMKARVLEPAVAVLCLHLLAERLASPAAPARRWWSYAALAAAVGGIAWEGVRSAPARLGFDANVRRVGAQVRALERLGDRTVLATLDSPFEAMLVWNRPLAVRFPARDVRLLPIQGWVTQSEGHRRAVDALGGGRGFGGLARAIQRDPDAFAVVGNRDAVERTLRWAALAYGVRLRVEERRAGPLPYFAFVGD